MKLCSCATVWRRFNSVEQGPSWEVNISPGRQEILRTLWNLKVHDLVCKSPPLAPTLSHVTPFHILRPYFCTICFNIILHMYAHVFRAVSFFQVFQPKPLKHFYSLPCMPHASPITCSLIWSPWWLCRWLSVISSKSAYWYRCNEFAGLSTYVLKNPVLNDLKPVSVLKQHGLWQRLRKILSVCLHYLRYSGKWHPWMRGSRKIESIDKRIR